MIQMIETMLITKTDQNKCFNSCRWSKEKNISFSKKRGCLIPLFFLRISILKSEFNIRIFFIKKTN